MLPETKAPNPFLPSKALTTGPFVTNTFPSILPYLATSCPQHLPTVLHSLQLIPGGNRDHVPFRLSEIKEIKKDLGSYTKNWDQYIQAFWEVSQSFELSWKDVMILLSQTLFPGETESTRSGSGRWG
jgi:hypothetical protein